MRENLKNIFQSIKYEPNIELKDKIWRSLVLRNRRTTYLKMGFFSFFGIGSLLGLIPILKMLLSDFTQSGFYEYLSLAFSNGGLFSSYWKEFVYSLIESLPTMSIIFSLVLLFIFFLSLHFIIKQIINNNPIGHTYAVA